MACKNVKKKDKREDSWRAADSQRRKGCDCRFSTLRKVTPSPYESGGRRNESPTEKRAEKVTLGGREKENRVLPNTRVILTSDRKEKEEKVCVCMERKGEESRCF